MADQQNQPTGSYQPTSGSTTGVNNDQPKGPYAQRMMPLPPMTTGPMQGATNVNVTPEGIGHTADKK